MQKPKIIIVQSQSFYVRALKTGLEKYGIQTEGEATDGYALLDLMESVRPDLVVLSLQLLKMDGNTVFNILRIYYPGVKVLILSQFTAEELVNNYIQRGVNGFIFNESLGSDLGNLAEVIKEIVLGSGYYFLDRLGLKQFTQKETRIAVLLCKGKTTGQIARVMNLSEKAIEKHRKNIYRKTESKNAAQFFKYAFTGGLEFMS